MPTPYQHLVESLAVLQNSDLPQDIRISLEAEKGAFLLGTTAGDVRYLTGKPRVETHFHEIPPDSVHTTVENLFQIYPGLADPGELSPPQAAFVSGYLLHLTWDVNWALHVFCPCYLNADTWSSWRAAMIHHNALRLVLDRCALANLSAVDVAIALRGARPDQWVPFIADDVLREWRDRIAHHLTTPQQVEGAALVFAKRMDISVDHLLSVAHAIETDAEESRVPGLGEALKRFRLDAQSKSLEVLKTYWHGIQWRVEHDLMDEIAN
jgi:hypothetical protein